MENSDRLFAIVADDDNVKLDESLKILEQYGDLIFCKLTSVKTIENLADIRVVDYPNEIDTKPKLYNKILTSTYACKKYKFLHILDSNVKILDHVEQFIDELEDMMTKLDYNLWLSTIADKCNYAYKKYNPRVRLSFEDTPNILKTKALTFNSNSNTAWIAYDLTIEEDKLLKFDENFTIPMYYIIELEARRKATGSKDSVYLMNMFFSVESEYGAYEVIEKPKQTDFSEEMQKKYKTENDIFTGLNLNITPDNDVEKIFEMIYTKLLNKKLISSSIKSK